MRTLTIAVVALVIDQVWLSVFVRSFGWWVGLLVVRHCFVASFNDFYCVLCIFWLLRSGMIQTIFVRGCPPKFQNSHGWLENLAGFYKACDFFRWLYWKKVLSREGSVATRSFKYVDTDMSVEIMEHAMVPCHKIIQVEPLTNMQVPGFQQNAAPNLLRVFKSGHQSYSHLLKILRYLPSLCTPSL